MGYTHYWRCNPDEIAKHPKLGNAIYDMWSVIIRGEIPLALSTIHEPSAWYQVRFNGVEGQDCETFRFPPTRDFNFCKTRAYPYDTVVTACLTIAAMHLPIRVSSNGGDSEWRAGVALASHVLGVDVPIPLTDEDEG